MGNNVQKSWYVGNFDGNSHVCSFQTTDNGYYLKFGSFSIDFQEMVSFMEKEKSKIGDGSLTVEIVLKDERIIEIEVRKKLKKQFLRYFHEIWCLSRAFGEKEEEELYTGSKTLQELLLKKKISQNLKVEELNFNGIYKKRCCDVVLKRSKRGNSFLKISTNDKGNTPKEDESEKMDLNLDIFSDIEKDKQSEEESGESPTELIVIPEPDDETEDTSEESLFYVAKSKELHFNKIMKIGYEFDYQKTNKGFVPFNISKKKKDSILLIDKKQSQKFLLEFRDILKHEQKEKIGIFDRFIIITMMFFTRLNYFCRLCTFCLFILFIGTTLCVIFFALSISASVRVSLESEVVYVCAQVERDPLSGVLTKVDCVEKNSPGYSLEQVHNYIDCEESGVCEKEMICSHSETGNFTTNYNENCGSQIGNYFGSFDLWNDFIFFLFFSTYSLITFVLGIVGVLSGGILTSWHMMILFCKPSVSRKDDFESFFEVQIPLTEEMRKVLKVLFRILSFFKLFDFVSNFSKEFFEFLRKIFKCYKKDNSLFRKKSEEISISVLSVECCCCWLLYLIVVVVVLVFLAIISIQFQFYPSFSTGFNSEYKRLKKEYKNASVTVNCLRNDNNVANCSNNIGDTFSFNIKDGSYSLLDQSWGCLMEVHNHSQLFRNFSFLSRYCFKDFEIKFLEDELESYQKSYEMSKNIVRSVSVIALLCLVVPIMKLYMVDYYLILVKVNDEFKHEVLYHVQNKEVSLFFNSEYLTNVVRRILLSESYFNKRVKTVVGKYDLINKEVLLLNFNDKTEDVFSVRCNFNMSKFQKNLVLLLARSDTEGKDNGWEVYFVVHPSSFYTFQSALRELDECSKIEYLDNLNMLDDENLVSVYEICQTYIDRTVESDNSSFGEDYEMEEEKLY